MSEFRRISRHIPDRRELRAAILRRKPFALFGLVLSLAFLVSCRQDMFNQPKSDPLEASPFFPDGADSRPIPAHTVAEGHLDADELFYTGMVDGKLAASFPEAVDMAMLQRGRQEFEIYCTPCHGFTGEGDGIVVQRGFPKPPSYHIRRLREAPVGHFFDVITNGYGVMYPYRDRVKPADRWAIIAYIRALQLSHEATLDDVPAADRAQLQEANNE